MSSYRCVSCGREIAAAPHCPHCGSEQEQWGEEVARIERSIAELKARDAALLKEQKQIAAKMQAALFQRDILAHANKKRHSRTNKPHRVLRRRSGRRPPTAEPGAPPPRIPRQPPFQPGDGGPPPPPAEPPLAGPDAGARPEASSREVQNVLLGLGALLLGVAAVVFAAVAISSLDDLSRLGILVGATALMLVAPPLVTRRGLTSTAETIAGVGLLLVALDGYALWAVDQVREGGLSGPVFAGLTCAVTAATAGVYAGATGLRLPGYAMVLALQPVLPLLAYDRIGSPVGWALVLTSVAAVDLYVGRLLTQRGRLVLPQWPGARDRADAPPATAPPAGATARSAGVDRPESAPEEADEVLRAEPVPPSPSAPAGARIPSQRTRGGTGPGDAAGDDDAGARWLRELTWILHGLAVCAALVYAAVALVDARTVPTAARAGSTLLLAAAIGLAGALAARRPPLPDVAAGVMTLAVIGAAGRVAAVALPGRALLLIAAVIAVVGLGVRAVPAVVRRGPQLASAVALIVIGSVVAGSALRAAVAPVRAALPAWKADLTAYSNQLADAVGPADWQLAAAAFLLTVAAVLSLPHEVRREFAVAGAALTALAVPASLALAWWAAPWPPVLTAVGVGVLGLSARTGRAAGVHVAAAGALGLAGTGAALIRPGLTAVALLLLAAGGALTALLAARGGPGIGPGARLVGDWAAGGAAFALPGAVAGFVTAAAEDPPGAPVGAVLAASFVAVCATLGYAALTLVSQREISMPLTVGTGLGALVVAAAAFGADGATVADAWVGALLVVAAVLLFLAPAVDAGRRADRLLDGPDLAAAAVTAALVATLTRIAAILLPDARLAAAAGLVLVIAAGIRALPRHWRRGPVLGMAAAGGLIALVAGYAALRGGLRALSAPGPLWNADLTAWSYATNPGGVWQAPVALLLLAGAAAVALPRPWAYDVAAACVGLATVGAPAALGLPWWSPIVVGCAVATAYGMAAVAAADPRAGTARAVVAAAVALHAVGASLVRPWTTAAALALVALIGTVVAVLARVVAALPDQPATENGPPPLEAADGMPAHLAQIGGAAAGGALLALPGAVAAFAAALHWPAEVVLTGALGASSLGVAVVALVRRQVPQYLPYATVGIAGGATVTAVASLPTDLPAGVYAAAAVLLGVLAELLRSASPLPGAATGVRRWSVTRGGIFRRLPDDTPRVRWSVSPELGAAAAAALPTALAIAAIAPALVAALVEPVSMVSRVWAGPSPAMVSPPPAAVAATNVLAALLLTTAAALAVTGFSGGTPALAMPVILPGVAVTLLIAPISLGAGWPHSTLAALGVFTISMLGLALTPPPPDVERARPFRVARVVVFVIGLAAGGAGLAGSLATRELTLFTLGGAVGVGAVAALFGRTQTARILGWLFAAAMAHAFVLTGGLVIDLAPMWSAFGVLAVGAALLLVAATAPRLRRPEALRETATVEWTGYASALVALALAYDSPRHIAALLAAWGAVLGVASTRRGRRAVERRALFWAAMGCEIVAWWVLMRIADVALPEAYTLPFAALALLVGLLELRERADLSSWLAYGPALVAALLPTLVIVVVGEASSLRQVLLLLGAVATLIFGSMRRQQAPVVIGGVVTALTALHAIAAYGPWLVLIPVGIVLLALGASNESRRRTQERLRALRGMR